MSPLPGDGDLAQVQYAIWLPRASARCAQPLDGKWTFWNRRCDSSSVDAGAVGKKLFIGTGSSASNTPTGSWMHMDNVYLEVSSVPEPSSAALIGLGGIALMLRRR